MKKIWLCISFVMLLLMVSCSKANSNIDDSDNDNKDISLKQEESNKRLQKLSSFSADFTISAYNQYKTKDKFVVSPLSVFMGLAMIGNSTQDTSSQQIYNALDLTHSEANSLAKELLSSMGKEYYSDELIENEGVVTKTRIGGFNIANSFWADSVLDLKKNAVLDLMNSLNTEVFKVDFHKDMKGCRINIFRIRRLNMGRWAWGP